ncbi:hypothetical protein POTOM_025147 [Populus tomentosa]|uniref:Uncharacterized protein n=1 Tax=Populus tomentosa TaxID=118781 RepID=A0A8X7ZDI0_POPTO|nr:hypothetical protein POTOM_025147 [Populus tomentosa]
MQPKWLQKMEAGGGRDRGFVAEGCEKVAIYEGELLLLGYGWRPFKGDEEVVGCVEADTPLLGGGDEDGGNGNLGVAGVAATLVGSSLWVERETR